MAALVLFWSLSPALADNQDLEKTLAGQYQDKIVVLRHCFTSSSQEYDSEGKPKGHPAEGPWTFYGRLLIKKIVVEDDKLHLEANRVAYKFDQDGLYLISVPERESVQVTIRLRSPLTSVDQAISVLGRVFAMTEEDIQNAVPAYWRPYLGKPPTASEVKAEASHKAGDADAGGAVNGEQIRKMGESGVSPPKPQFMPAPGFQAKPGFSGLVGLNVVIDTSGRISTVKVVRSLGKGLDEEAIRAVKTWRFAPGMRAGHPVAVAVYLEVDFQPYRSP